MYGGDSIMSMASGTVSVFTEMVDNDTMAKSPYKMLKGKWPEKYDEMVADIKARTGLNITKCEVGYIDFLKDTAFVKVYYETESQEINTIDQVTRAKDFNG